MKFKFILVFPGYLKAQLFQPYYQGHSYTRVWGKTQFQVWGSYGLGLWGLRI